jgi:hypothetical protein
MLGFGRQHIAAKKTRMPSLHYAASSISLHSALANHQHPSSTEIAISFLPWRSAK